MLLFTLAFSTLGIISPMWIDMDAALKALSTSGYDVSDISTFKDFKNFVLKMRLVVIY